MKKQFFQQEILLVTNTVAKHNKLCTGNAKTNICKGYKSELVKACGKRLLHEMLQGIVERSAALQNIYPWRLHQKNDILEIELGVYPLPVEEKFSINAGAFLTVVQYN